MSHSSERILQQRQQLQKMAQGYRQAQILMTCVELGVFEVLVAGPATAPEISQAIGADARGTELLLNAATALDLLEKDGERFGNTPLAETYLLVSSPASLVSALRLQNAFYQRWGRLAEAVRSGQRPAENRGDEQPADWIQAFVHGLYTMARPAAPAIASAIAEALPLAPDRPLRLIDVGGCHGAYSMALAQRYPLLTATVYELPRVAPVAREIIAEAGMSAQVAVQEGDFQSQELGAGYDMALVFGVLNGESPTGRPALIHKVFRAINPGGWIVLRDFVLDPNRAGPPEAAIFALQMLLATDAGGVDTRTDWKTWLTMAGFTGPQEVRLPEWIGATLTLAQKPA
ncbi:MAG: class I SAM-dependent methyltransferase [Chloroflexota bacterium]